MLLQSLREFTHAAFDPPPRLYNYAKVRYIVDLTEQGQAVGWYDKYESASKPYLRCLMPQLDKRSSNIVALPFFGNSEYTFGLPRSENDNLAKVSKRHTAYIELIQECLVATSEPAVQAVLTFLQNDPVGQLTALKRDEFTKFDRTANITFMVDGRFVVDLPAVQSFWADKNDPDAAQRRELECIVCHKVGPVLDTLELTIKGLPGGNPKGVPIFSANSPAFESYGLEGAYIAPVCAACAERFTKVLNFLLEQEDSHFSLGNLKFAFWTRGRDAAPIMRTLHQPRKERQRQKPVTAGAAKSTFEAPYHAQSVPENDTSRFYAVGLAANPGRAIIRDWIDTTLVEADRNVKRWVRLHRIIDPKIGKPQEFDIWSLAAATIRKKAKGEERKPALNITYALLHSAIVGEQLPSGLLHQVLRRCQTEQAVSTERAALIKLVLLSQPDESIKEHMQAREDFMERSEPDFQANPRITAAYHCGRAWAVLERIQEVDMGRATTATRLFGAAIVTPGLTMPMLVRAAYQVHLPRIRESKRGAYLTLRPQLDAALASVPRTAGIPPTLKLPEQGWFVIGYQHQRAEDQATRQEKRAAKQSEAEAEQADLFNDSTAD